MTVLAEPNVPMDSLLEACLQHGLLPPVVMEFPGITVGGGFAGTAGESSSFSEYFSSDRKWTLSPDKDTELQRLALSNLPKSLTWY